MDWIGTQLQAIFTILLLTIVFADNEGYRFSAHTYVGLGAGYTVAVTWFNYIRPSFQQYIIAEGRWSYIVPIIIGILIYTRYIPGLEWISRYHICFLLGIGSGYILSTTVKPMFIDQIKATFLPFWGTGDWWQNVSNKIYVIGTLSVISYFLFTVEKKGVHGGVSKVGRWVLMATFGASFGNSVLARVSLFLGRMQFLLGEWLHIIEVK